MSTKEEGEEKIETPLVDEGEEAFASGFVGEGEEASKAPAKVEGEEGTPKAKDGEGNESKGAKEEPPIEVATPKYVQLTEEQVRVLQAGADKAIQLEAKMGDQFAKAFGTIGSLKQALEKISGKGEIDAAELDQMEKDFPELGAQLKKILVRAPVKPVEAETRGGVVTTESQIEELFKKRDLESKIKEIDEVHPGWIETVGALGSKTPFREWLVGQGKEYEDRINATQSTRLISSALDKFKAEQETAKKATSATTGGTQAAAPQNRGSTNGQARRDRFAAAVTPRGTGQAPPKAKTEADHFNEGFATG